MNCPESDEYQKERDADTKMRREREAYFGKFEIHPVLRVDAPRIHLDAMGCSWIHIGRGEE